jgi:hypothetical protein
MSTSTDTDTGTDTGNGTVGLKRSRDEEKCENGNFCKFVDSEAFKLCREYALMVGKDWCGRDDLIRRNLIRFIGTDDVTRIDDWIEVVVSDLSGSQCETFHLPCGEGLSSIWHVKVEVNKLFGVKEKLQVLIDVEANLEHDNVTDVELKDSFVLHKKDCGSMGWNLGLMVAQCEEVYKWEEPDASSGQDHYKVHAGGSVYVPTTNLWPKRDEIYRRVGILPTLTPAAGIQYHHVGIYTISFALRYNVVDLAAPTRTHLLAAAPVLEKKCWIGLAEVALDEACHLNEFWKIDAFNGTLFERQTAIFHDEVDFLDPGHVLTLKLDCSIGKLTFFRDGVQHGTLHLRSNMAKLQFVAHIPIVGFEVAIVDDPILVHRFR